MRGTLSLRQTGFEILQGCPGGGLPGTQETDQGRVGGSLGVDELMEGGGKKRGLRMESRAGSKVKEGDCKEWEGE